MLRLFKITAAFTGLVCDKKPDQSGPLEGNRLTCILVIFLIFLVM